MVGKTHEAILFSKCTGLNDSTETTGPQWFEDGTTDLRGCLNVTVTQEGKLVKVPDFTNVIQATNPITELVESPSKLYAQTGTVLGEYYNNAFNTLANSSVFTAGVKAKYIKTPLGIRVNLGGETSYKVNEASGGLVELGIGTYNGPVSSKVLSKMPAFDSGFVLGTKLYTAKGKFLQHSHDSYNYDSFNLADDYLAHLKPVLQSGQIPGCVITTQADGITAWVGTGPADFAKTFYPCQVIDRTLYSGIINKLNEYAHVFMCNDGVYVLTADGKLLNATVNNTEKLNVLNTTYNTVACTGGKYFAFGDSICVEYDFQVKAVTLRSHSAITCAGKLSNQQYFGAGVFMTKFASTDNMAVIPVDVKLPYSDFGTPSAKQVRFLYFTGTITGAASFTVRNQYGQSVTKSVNALGYVQNYKIDSLRTCKGQKLSVEIAVTSGMFRLEELRGSFFTVSSRH